MALDAETSTGFSFENPQRTKHEALATIRHFSARITSLAMAIESLDVAMISAVAVRSIDTQAALTTAAQRLSELLADDRGVT